MSTVMMKPTEDDGCKKPAEPCLRLIAATHNERCKPSAYGTFKNNNLITTKYYILDVTSKNHKASPNLVFSPLLGVGMEADWQQCKRYEGIDAAEDRKWWDKARKRMQEGKKCPRRSNLVIKYRKAAKDGKYPTEIGYVCPTTRVMMTDKVEARKKIYVPLYQKMVLGSKEGKARLAGLREMMQASKDKGESLTIIVKDYDGPRTDDGRESWCWYDAGVHAKKIRDLRFSFGHGYCVLQALEKIGKEVFDEV